MRVSFPIHFPVGGCRFHIPAVTGLLMALAVGAFAKDPPSRGVWEQIGEARELDTEGLAMLRPTKAGRVRFDPERFQLAVEAIRAETPEQVGNPVTEIRIPDPDGNWRRFQLIESPVMAPELAAKFPELKSYRGISPDDPTAHLRMSVSHKGCRVQVLSASGAFYVEPYLLGDSLEHLSYYRSDLSPQAVGLTEFIGARVIPRRPFHCSVRHPKKAGAPRPAPINAAAIANRTGESLRTLRLAIATTGEYTAYHGGTVQDAMAALNDLVTRVTGIYEVEVAVRLVLVANNNRIVHTNASTDPYGSNPISNVQSDIDSQIGNANYDVGHVVSTGNGGVASLGSVYVDGRKAQGFTGLTHPVGDPFYVDYVAHELGHQFGANHTFNNGSVGSCAGGNRNASTAYEPGSGSTIMGYAGICGNVNNLQSNSDPYFHSASLDEINAHLVSVGVPAGTPTGNTVPHSIEAGPDLTIPANTSFALTASATDPDEDTLTYCWEQRDLGPAQELTDEDNGSSPLFRSLPPSTSPTRTFPRLAELLQNTTPKGERMPTKARSMAFRVTVRDNRAGGGGVDADDRTLTVDTQSGPFVVTYPNTAVSLPSGSHTVTWDVANTNLPPVNAPRVSLLLSTDGGNTFPTTLVADTPNDGSQPVILPAVNTSTARIKVAADTHVFFDVSNQNFTIRAPASPSLFIEDLQVAEGDSGTTATSIKVALTPPNPSQTVSVGFATQNGTATAGADYLSTSGTVVFQPGETSRTIPLTLYGDTVYEGDETFTVALNGPVNALLEDAQGVVTLLENDPPPPVINSAATDTAVIDVPYEYRITASNSPTGYGATGTLPAGLRINTATGVISGTPTAVGTSNLTLSATNASGTGTLMFTLRVVEDPLAVVVDQDRLRFTTSGAADWFAQSATTHDGVDAAQSGDVDDGGSSVLSTTVTGPDVIAFWWKVSSEKNYDLLQVLVDGSVVRSISGDVDWQQSSVSVSPGQHTVAWRYLKDGSASDGTDAGWVDEVVLGSASPLPLVSSNSLAVGAQGKPFAFQVTATGAPPGSPPPGCPPACPCTPPPG